MNDSQLTERAASGDVQAFEELMALYQNKVYTMAWRMTGSREDALDVSQEVFLRVWRSLPEFKGESKVSTWIYRITSNLCTDYLRKRSRAGMVSLTSDGEDENQQELPDDKYSPERALEKSELSAALRTAIDALKPDWREVFLLRELDDLSYGEISHILGVEEGTIKSRLFRARRQLQVFLRRGGNIPAVPPSNVVKGGDEA